MFTLEQIQDAHSKVKSGADFPQYTRDLIALGVLSYAIYVQDGHAEYTGKGSFSLKSEATYPTLEVAGKSDTEYFKQRLKIHQQGQTNYLTFCKDAADCGVAKWVVDTARMTCTYYTPSGDEMLEEIIPT